MPKQKTKRAAMKRFKRTGTGKLKRWHANHSHILTKKTRAVLDTGVRYDHPALQSVAAGGNLLPGYDMISDLDVANDGDGRDADASDPGDWITAAEANEKGGPLHGCTE